jgi:maltose alpha-D-glucosyltransferase / alpha-amylase
MFEELPSMIGRGPLWYKDAIVYQLHVKAFFDSNNDGMGDFAGLTEKLDYLADLGVTAVWLLPFYPSPQRDDGYDIAHYKSVNPDFGDLRDVRRFVREAHKRGLHVITELVINHTSDQHPWFQRARQAKPGSVARDFYVWSDTDQKYQDTRIIFCDTEPSNWSWDPVAKAYYWHRFFGHQPDLNFDNPRVFEEVTRVMKFWLDAGVDGLRLDAIPYLVEREGTNNENLPETHDIIRRLRAWMDEHFEGRMLLGEANQWPEDVLPYFGDGDECHMAFHFPLMPRMYMALAQEDRHPITDILRQTPDIPDSCQWAVFLRNHDELTLEMVTDRERDYLWQFYAADKRARINLGIRRRLATLLDNDRRKIELLNSLLMSMPGTPIVYYGDEIGMGDNIFLGDRNGVRTPMQWSPDRNAGFSKADPQSLYLPPIMDAMYGYEAVNVEAQSRSQSSLLNWMKRLIAVRKMHPVFGRGKLTFLYPGNRKVFAYLRENGDEVIFCIANLSRAPQPVEIDLSAFAGRVPVELLGRTVFPPIGDLPYFITLPGYGFYWFLLTTETEAPAWHEPAAPPMPDLQTLVFSRGWSGVLSDKGGEVLTQQILPGFLANQRWFAGKNKRIDDVTLQTHGTMDGGGTGFLVTACEVELEDKSSGRYVLPLAVTWEAPTGDSFPGWLPPHALAKVRKANRIGLLHDAMADASFAAYSVRAIMGGLTVPTSDGGRIIFTPTQAMNDIRVPADYTARPLNLEQSNSSAQVGDTMIFKLYRKLARGVHPEVEIGAFLTDVAKFANVPPLLGSVEWIEPDGTSNALGILQGRIVNQGDGWAYTLDFLARHFETRFLHGVEPAEPEEAGADIAVYLRTAETLGHRLGELHAAFTTETDDPAFAPQPVTAVDLKDWRRAIRKQAGLARTALKKVKSQVPADIAVMVGQVLDEWSEVENLVARATFEGVKLIKTRCHGDLHLGQVLIAKDDVYVLDFEGEPARTLKERRAKTSPLRDVAGMVRSFDYAAWAALFERATVRTEALEQERGWAEEWQHAAQGVFLAAYQEATVACSSVPRNKRVFKRLLDLFVLEKVLYEICYEANNRPDWLQIPIRGLHRVLVGRT